MDYPQTIGRYRVLGRMRGGGQETELFEVEHVEGPGERLCLKRVHPNYADNPMFATRFEQELAIAQTLRHRNIVELSDFGADDGHFFVMEYIDGPSLRALLSAGPLTPGLVAYIGTELLRALAFLHHSDPAEGRGPLIHSDLSPHNVLLERSAGGVKLADFGVAKALGRTGDVTITRARGKPTYMSPEQLTDGKVSARTDLFSLGLVLWHALVGRHPYVDGRPQTEPPTQVATWIRDSTIANRRDRVADVARHAPPALCAAIEGLLQPIATRIPTAEDVHHVLRSAEPLDGHERLVAWIAQSGL